MDTTDYLAIVAILVSVVSAGFTFWQGLLAKRANQHAADSAEAAKASAEAAANQDRRDAERDLRQQTGWTLHTTGAAGTYELTNATNETVYFMRNDDENAAQLINGEDRLIPGASALFTVPTQGSPSKTVSLSWNDGTRFKQRVMKLPDK